MPFGSVPHTREIPRLLAQAAACSLVVAAVQRVVEVWHRPAPDRILSLLLTCAALVWLRGVWRGEVRATGLALALLLSSTVLYGFTLLDDRPDASGFVPVIKFGMRYSATNFVLVALVVVGIACVTGALRSRAAR
ncbi:MAG TPA: hypothetical protein VF266_08565 [Thermoanaerobaculia bacterium]